MRCPTHESPEIGRLGEIIGFRDPASNACNFRYLTFQHQDHHQLLRLQEHVQLALAEAPPVVCDLLDPLT